MRIKRTFSKCIITILIVGVTTFPESLYPSQYADRSKIVQRPSKYCMLQIGSFRNKTNAIHFQSRWQKLVKYPVRVRTVKGYYRVIIERVPSTVLNALLTNLHALNDTVTICSSRLKSTNNMQPPLPRLERIIPPLINLNDKDLPNRPQRNGFIGMDVGLLNAKVNSVYLVNNGSLFEDNEDIDRYSSKGFNSVDLAFEGGLSWSQPRYWLPQYDLGLRYQHLFSHNITGTIMQYSLPSKVNYTYNWSIQTEVLSAYTQLDLVKLKYCMPYINFGLGVAFNRAGAYSETAYPDITPRVSPGYVSGIHTNFTYDIGAGIDIPYHSNYILSLKYDYQHLGALSSGQGQTTWSGEHLSAGNLSANSFLVGIRYVFGKQTP